MEQTNPLSLSGIDAAVWPALYSGTSIGEGEALTLSFEQFTSLDLSAAGDIYLEIPGDFDLQQLSGLDLSRLRGIGIRFPAFNDGRGFTTAVWLRRDYHFTGELRAFGHVIPDQAQFLSRTGFDTAEVTDARRAAFIRGKDRFQVRYQTDVNGLQGAGHLARRHSSEAALVVDVERRAS